MHVASIIQQSLSDKTTEQKQAMHVHSILDWTYSDQRFFIFSYFFFGSCGRLSCLICQLSSARIYSIFTSDVFLDRDQGLGLEAPRGQK